MEKTLDSLYGDILQHDHPEVIQNQTNIAVLSSVVESLSAIENVKSSWNILDDNSYTIPSGENFNFIAASGEFFSSDYSCCAPTTSGGIKVLRSGDVNLIVAGANQGDVVPRSIAIAKNGTTILGSNAIVNNQWVTLNIACKANENDVFTIKNPGTEASTWKKLSLSVDWAGVDLNNIVTRAAWGNISGDINNQTDLINHIEDKTYFDIIIRNNNWSDLKYAIESGLYTKICVEGFYGCEDNITVPLSAHENVRLIKGCAVIDISGSVNNNIETFLKIPYKCQVDGLHFLNLDGNSPNGIDGSSSSDLYSYSKVSNVIFQNIANGSTAFRHVEPTHCIAENDSSVGAYGLGNGFLNCRNIINCQSKYISTGFGWSDLVSNCFGNHNNTAFVDCKEVVGCETIYSWRGFWNCHRVAGCHSTYSHYAYLNNTDLGYNNTEQNTFGEKFTGNTMLPREYMDSADNTKRYEFNSVKLNHNTLTTYELQPHEGKLALMDGENDGIFYLPMTMHNDLSGNVNPNIRGGVIWKYRPDWSGPFIHDFSYGNNGTVTIYGDNAFVGVGAGNLTMGASGTVSYHASYNTGVGARTLTKLNNGFNNTAIGSWALNAFEEGRDNIALGVASMMNLTGGSYNTSLGGNSMRSLVKGDGNISLGTYSNYFSKEYDSNVCIGHMNFTWSHNNYKGNTSIGSQAGGRCGTDYNVFLGYGAGHRCTTSGTLIIDNKLRSTAADEKSNAILWGQMKPTAAEQELNINAQTNLTQGLILKRRTITSSETLTKNDILISVKPTANTDVTLYNSPIDGQVVEIYTVNLDYTITIKGSVNGTTDYIISSAKDNIRLVYNADESTWEIR